MNNHHIYIGGMHCVACELSIVETIKNINGVKSVKVNHRSGIAQVDYDGDRLPFKDIAAKIEELGYQASLEPIAKRQDRASKEQWFYAIAIVFALYLVYRYLTWIGLLNWLNVSTENVGYGAAFLIGIVASLSTCLMVVGSVVISFASKYQASGGFYKQSVKPHLLFHLGRLATFFVLGGILGSLGSWFNPSQSFNAWFTIIFALILAWLALNILGLVPSLSSIGVRMPKKSLGVLQKMQESDHALAPMLLGGFTFFLPCGFTQSMQLLAMATGNFWAGGMLLFLFALGTMPVLMGLGVATARFKNLQSIVWQKTIGIIVLVFAFYSLSSGLALAGVNKQFIDKQELGQAINQNNAQVINMTVYYSGFSPNVFRLKKDVPVRWIIDGREITGCTNQVIVPDFGIRKNLQAGENIIEFIPTKSGTIGFSCGMGMVRGKFIVE